MIPMGIRTLDLFCGAGGSSWGAQSAGAEIVCGVDAWPVAADTYQLNFPKAHVVNACLTPESGPEIFGRDIGPIDLILASPECTNHTCARGNRPRKESSRLTAMHVFNFIDHFEPRQVVLENVVHMKKWKRYEEVLSGFRNRGYHFRTMTLDAADFGIPQNRRRLFIVCDREQPVPEVRPVPGTRIRTVRDILDPVGTHRRGPVDNGRRAKATLERFQRGVDALGEETDFLLVYYGSDAAGGWQSLDRPIRTLTTLDRFGLVEWDSGQPTLRMLQPSELRRAMGFGKDFQLPVCTRRNRVKVLGNGVAPPVMGAIINTVSKDIILAPPMQKTICGKQRSIT